VDHPYTSGHRITGARKLYFCIVQKNAALIGLVETVEEVHQRGLAGAILPEQRVDFAGLHDKRNFVVRDNGAKSLRHPLQFKLHCLVLLWFLALSIVRKAGGAPDAGPGPLRYFTSERRAAV
jgi:hypothetical protein